MVYFFLKLTNVQNLNVTGIILNQKKYITLYYC